MSTTCPDTTFWNPQERTEIGDYEIESRWGSKDGGSQWDTVNIRKEVHILCLHSEQKTVRAPSEELVVLLPIFFFFLCSNFGLCTVHVLLIIMACVSLLTGEFLRTLVSGLIYEKLVIKTHAWMWATSPERYRSEGNKAMTGNKCSREIIQIN